MEERDFIDSPRILFMSGNLEASARRCGQLALAGWQIVQTIDPIESLAAGKNKDVDLALLHLPVDDMVEMDLPNVLRRVAPMGYLPVVILAEDPAEQQRCRFLDSGADDIISGTTSAAEMIARLKATLRIKELHDQLAASRSALQEALFRERRLLTELRKDYAHMQVLATTDPLTHIQNVRSFRDIFEHEFRIARRYNQPLSLLMIDVDHFKVVNDMHGHPTGDYVLKELAVVLTQSVRESDVVARTGGEEFSVILPKADARSAAHFAERIRREVFARQFAVYGEEIHVTVSLGSASYPQDAEITEPEMLVYFADQALLIAKETGRDRVVNFGELDLAVRHRLRRQYLAPLDLEAVAQQDDEEKTRTAEEASGKIRISSRG